MSMTTRRLIWQWLVLGLAAVPLGGCAVLPDLLSENLVLGLGLDPGTLSQSGGVVLVAFNNTTRSPAYFTAFYSVDTVDLSRESRNFSVEVGAGEVKNEVIECPVGLIGPGTLGADYSYSPVAAQAASADGTTVVDVTYTGPPVQVGMAFTCGDVIEIRLSESPGADAAQTDYVITVRVLRGQ